MRVFELDVHKELYEDISSAREYFGTSKRFMFRYADLHLTTKAKYGDVISVGLSNQKNKKRYKMDIVDIINTEIDDGVIFPKYVCKFTEEE